MNEDEPQLFLASRSPRRQVLLEQIGIRFATIAADADETQLAGERPLAYVGRLAMEKARAGRAGLPTREDRPVLAADTAVVIGDRVLGKPRDRADAASMLRLLSGRQHQVLTAVAVISLREEGVEVSASTVSFRTLGDREIQRYWDTGEPADKAGAYAIQGLGSVFVAHLAGSYSGVMGLPLFETGQLLGRFGIEVLPAAMNDPWEVQS